MPITPKVSFISRRIRDSIICSRYRKEKLFGKSLSDAMRDVEKNNPSLSGVLPKTYEIFMAPC